MRFLPVWPICFFRLDYVLGDVSRTSQRSESSRPRHFNLRLRIFALRSAILAAQNLASAKLREQSLEWWVESSTEPPTSTFLCMSVSTWLGETPESPLSSVSLLPYVQSAGKPYALWAIWAICVDARLVVKHNVKGCQRFCVYFAPLRASRCSAGSCNFM